MTPKELREWRVEHDFSPLQLGDALNVTRNSVYRWEAGAVPLPNELAERLLEVAAKRKTEAPPANMPDDSSVFDLATEQPHGSVIGLTRDFWREMIEVERKAWIEQAPNPLLALPWPHWSHGWEWYPVRPMVPGGRMPQKQPHWLKKSSIIAVKKAMDEFAGTPTEKLHKAVLFLCRRDKPSWPDAG